MAKVAKKTHSLNASCFKLCKGFAVRKGILFLQYYHPYGVLDGVDSFLLQYYHPYGVWGGVDTLLLKDD